MRIKAILTTAVISLAATVGHAAIDFSFTYTGGPTGFNDPVQGANRKLALEQAASFVESFFVNYTATLVMAVDGTETDNSTLAAAGSNVNSAAPPPGFGNRGDVMLKILGGNAADPSLALPDGTVTWNFQDHQWELASDFQAGEFDFFSTAAHELFHAVGFSSDIAQNGRDTYNTVPGNPGMWAPFDQWVAGATGSIINGGTFALDITRWNTASVGGAGTGLRFNGPQTLAANGGNPAFLFSPTTWSNGSSGSHLDDGLYTGTYMMEAATNPGLSTRTFSALEQAMLRDIGYTALVPEPSTGLLLLSSLGAFFLRRARHRRE